MKTLVKTLSMSALLLAGACTVTPTTSVTTDPSTNTTTTTTVTTVDYTQVIAYANNAYAVLKPIVDAKVQAGQLNAASVSLAEQNFAAALAAAKSTDGTVTLTVKGTIQKLYNALVTFQTLAPAGEINNNVLTALQVAEGAMAAFLALDPASAVLVQSHVNKLTLVR